MFKVDSNYTVVFCFDLCIFPFLSQEKLFKIESVRCSFILLGGFFLQFGVSFILKGVYLGLII